jgi:hypothetical protein
MTALLFMGEIVDGYICPACKVVHAPETLQPLARMF